MEKTRPNENDALVVQGLRKNFGGMQAVKDATFSVPVGKIIGLIGPNGAGKSTILSMIAGELPPSAGSVLFLGTEIAGTASHRVARMGLIRTFQASSEFPELTVLENLLVAAPMQRRETFIGAILGKRYWRDQESAEVQRARSLLERFEMDKEDEYAGNLSGGQKRLLELMRALMARPKLLLLDEPMAGVNPSLARRVERHLLELRDEGLTMLMVEHELGTVERLCNLVVAMADGRVIAKGSMEEVRNNQDVLDAYLIG